MCLIHWITSHLLDHRLRTGGSKIDLLNLVLRLKLEYTVRAYNIHCLIFRQGFEDLVSSGRDASEQTVHSVRALAFPSMQVEHSLGGI